MAVEEFRKRVMDGTPLAGTFMKTPAVDILEVLILGGLDFVCLDAEHAPFDRAALNGLCAVARAPISRCWCVCPRAVRNRSAWRWMRARMASWCPM
jgi:2-keto-3-deoxy-L-rhamnonate aldolase RhmA